MQHLRPIERWLGKFGQPSEWISCLTAAMVPRSRGEHDEANPPDTPPRPQGEGGFGCHQGREDAGPWAKLFDVRPHQITAWKARVQWGRRPTCLALALLLPRLRRCRGHFSQRGFDHSLHRRRAAGCQ